MNINGNSGNMPSYGNTPFYGNQPSFQMPSPMPPAWDCGPKGGIIPNFSAPKGADTINFYGKTGPDLINYYGGTSGKSYTMQSYQCPPGVYTMVDMEWGQPSYPQPNYNPQPMPNYNWGAKY